MLLCVIQYTLISRHREQEFNKMKSKVTVPLIQKVAGGKPKEIWMENNHSPIKTHCKESFKLAKARAQKLENLSTYIACATLNQPHSAYALHYKF